MRSSRPLTAALLAAASLLLAQPPAISAVAAPAPRDSFLEDFAGPAGALPDPASWSFDTGGAWGNRQELQAYTAAGQNAALDGRGDLVIAARRQAYTGADGITRAYTSARLQTWRKFDFAYGHVAARIRVPGGAGLWPAFWALGDSAYASGDWPASGEIDVMELLGAHPSVAYGTLHGPSRSARGWALRGVYRAQSSLADGFHVYSADWRPQAITFAVDGHPYRTITRAQLPPGAGWPFDHPFFLVLNLAVGGAWGGPPAASTRWPARMIVDWVRVTPTSAAAARRARAGPRSGRSRVRGGGGAGRLARR